MYLRVQNTREGHCAEQGNQDKSIRNAIREVMGNWIIQGLIGLMEHLKFRLRSQVKQWPCVYHCSGLQENLQFIVNLSLGSKMTFALHPTPISLNVYMLPRNGSLQLLGWLHSGAFHTLVLILWAGVDGRGNICRSNESFLAVQFLRLKFHLLPYLGCWVPHPSSLAQAPLCLSPLSPCPILYHMKQKLVCEPTSCAHFLLFLMVTETWSLDLKK